MKEDKYVNERLMRDRISILVTFDKTYIKPFRVMIKSLSINNPKEAFHVWLLHSAIPQEDVLLLSEYCSAHRMTLTTIDVDRALFHNAPISKQYPQEMYYRLLAPWILPKSLDRVIYLDPDILVINSIRPLWEVALGDYSFAASSHSGVFEIVNGVNRVRLGNEHDYFNTGVLYMDLKKIRLIGDVEEIFSCVREREGELLLPDQDVFNLIYGSQILQMDDSIFNYDARYFSAYVFKSKGRHDLDWVLKHTIILHFCGKQKPWKKRYTGLFSALYKHYMILSDREGVYSIR